MNSFLKIFLPFLFGFPMSHLNLTPMDSITLKNLFLFDPLDNGDSMMMTHDKIFLENIPDHLNTLNARNYLARHQVAFDSKRSCFETNQNGYLNETSPHDLSHRCHGNGSIFIFLAAPSTLEDFILDIEQISQFYAGTESKNEMRDRKMFFVSWPFLSEEPEPDDDDTDEVASGIEMEVQNFLQKNEKIQKSILKISPNGHVYILQYFKPKSENMVQDNGDIKLVRIFEIYGLQKNKSIVSPFPFKKGHFLSLEDLIPFVKRRDNFQRVSIKTLGKMDSDYTALLEMVVSQNGNKTVEFRNGTAFRTLLDLETALNFTYEPIMGKDWITVDTNGELTGIGKQILDGEADISITPSAVTVPRVEKLAFFQPIMAQKSSVYFRQPPVATVRNIFTMPFTSGLWGAILATIIGLTATLLCLITWDKRWRRGAPNFRNVGTSKLYAKLASNANDWCGWTDVYVWIISLVCRQGCRTPLNLRMRCILLTGMMASIVLFSIYTAGLVVFISHPEVPIRNFGDLEKNHFMTFVNPDVLGYASAFMEDEDQGQKLRERSKGIYTNELNGVDKIMGEKSGQLDSSTNDKNNNKWAFIIPPDAFYIAARGRYKVEELCEVSELQRNPGTPIHYSIFITKGSALREFISVTLMRMLQRGFTQRYWHEYKLKAILRCLENPPGPHELHFMDFLPAFLMLLIGQLLAVCIGVVEKCWKKFMTKFYEN